MSKTVPPYLLRKHTDDDKGFIYQNWIKLYHESCPINFCINDIYLPNQNRIIDNLLETANTLIACNPEDPTLLLGFICYEFVQDVMVVHWMHIRGNMRFRGLATDILQSLYPTAKSDPILVTHNFRTYSELRHKFCLSYDPYFITTRLLNETRNT